MSAISFLPSTNELSIVKQESSKEILPDEVEIAVAFSGVCGTDVHISEGHFPCLETGVVLGHEFSGVVKRVGRDVSHVKKGDRVVADPNNACNRCSYCTTGRYHLCKKEYTKSNLGVFRDGGWAQVCVVPAPQVFKLPDTITLEQGALCEPLSCLAHGWDRVSPVTIGQTILIQGSGIIGNLWAALLHLQGHKRVTVSEPNASRRKLFLNLETGYAIVDPNDLSKGYRADLIIDCSGVASAIEKALNLLAPGGKLCIFGVTSPKARISVSPYELYKREATIIAVLVNPFSFPRAIGLLEALGPRYLDYNRLGVQMFELKQYKEALKTLKEGIIALWKQMENKPKENKMKQGNESSTEQFLMTLKRGQWVKTKSGLGGLNETCNRPTSTGK